jgi:sugar lactone lactonase YvrE
MWVATARNGSVVRLDTCGRRIDECDVPAEVVTSVCFAPAPSGLLFVVTGSLTSPNEGGAVFAIDTDAVGLDVPAARVQLGANHSNVSRCEGDD